MKLRYHTAVLFLIFWESSILSSWWLLVSLAYSCLLASNIHSVDVTIPGAAFRSVAWPAGSCFSSELCIDLAQQWLLLIPVGDILYQLLVLPCLCWSSKYSNGCFCPFFFSSFLSNRMWFCPFKKISCFLCSGHILKEWSCERHVRLPSLMLDGNF